MAKKHSRRMSKKHRGSKRKHASRSRRNRHRQRGGESSPASVGGNPMAPMMAQSLSQGQQYEKMHAPQHGGSKAATSQRGGGGLDAGPFPGAVTDQSLIPASMAAAARVAPLNAALKAIENMGTPGMAGGARRRGKKSRKASKKSRKSGKASRKSRKGSKGRKTRKMRGGAAFGANAASVNAPGMLLDHSQMSKALSGMNAEWKLASNPAAFAPGVAKNY